MDTRVAYDKWSKQYDTNENKTRDLEEYALQTTLAEIRFDSCLEIGCGTGKNTKWFLTKAKQITAIDISNEMLAKAKEKVSSANVEFQQADITQGWTFTNKQFELISFSLVLEHIENLDNIFREVAKITISGGYVYIGELHPYKQYTGTKARFDTEGGQQILTCFKHNISDFIRSAKQYKFEIVDINEYFDSNNRTTIPRILTLLLHKRQ